VSRGAAQRLMVFLPPRGSLLEGDGGGSLSATALVAYGGIDASHQPCSAGDAQLSLLPKALSVDLLFDVSDLFTTYLEAPRMSEARLRQALPSLVEEHLLTDAADCQLAYRVDGSEGNVTRVAVAAIERVTLARALETAAEAQVQPRNAYSALYSIPPPAAGTLSVRVHRSRGTVRTAEHSGFAFDLDHEAPAALAVAVQQLGILRIHAYGRDAAKLVAFSPELGVDVVDMKSDFDAASISGAVNLLQGRFAPAGRFSVPTIAALMRSSHVKPLSAWAAVWLAIFVIGLNAYSWKLESEAHALKSSMQTAFRSAFPNESLVDTVAQTKIHLRELRARAGQSSPDDFTVLNAQAAQLLAGAPAGSLAGIEYRDAALTLKFKPGVAASAGFQNALRAQAAQQGLNMRFDPDGSAHVVPSAQ
jgi:general secretion pathway protein L